MSALKKAVVRYIKARTEKEVARILWDIKRETAATEEERLAYIKLCEIALVSK